MRAQKVNVIEVENGYHPLTGEPVRYGLFAFYACGHCSGQQYLPSLHDTPSYRCGYCSRYLCESALCNAGCTPLYSLAKDHFEGADKWTKLLPAIMAGATTPEEGIALGLPKETFNG